MNSVTVNIVRTVHDPPVKLEPGSVQDAADPWCKLANRSRTWTRRCLAENRPIPQRRGSTWPSRGIARHRLPEFRMFPEHRAIRSCVHPAQGSGGNLSILRKFPAKRSSRFSHLWNISWLDFNSSHLKLWLQRYAQTNWQSMRMFIIFD